MADWLRNSPLENMLKETILTEFHVSFKNLYIGAEEN
jgi:hypothetical protein